LGHVPVVSGWRGDWVFHREECVVQEGCGVKTWLIQFLKSRI
jgi:hypothetical protein